MILGERLSADRDGPLCSLLSLLEVGSVAILLALLLLGNHVSSHSFASFIARIRRHPQALC